jgi:hypothetical protein
MVPSEREKVVQAGNIGEFSQLLPQCGKPLFLQAGRMRGVILETRNNDL